MDVSDASAVFSVFHLTRTGVQLGIPIGQQFCPTGLSRALRRQCRSNPSLPFGIFIVQQGIIYLDLLLDAVESKPQIILIPLRLGAECLNNDYSSLIKASLSTPYSLGIIGGRSSRAFYIVGFQDDALLYLDPHLLRTSCTNLDQIIGRREYHTRSVCELSLPQLDPTILFGFCCKNRAEVDSLAQALLAVPVPMPLFSVVTVTEQS